MWKTNIPRVPLAKRLFVIYSYIVEKCKLFHFRRISSIPTQYYDNVK